MKTKIKGTSQTIYIKINYNVGPCSCSSLNLLMVSRTGDKHETVTAIYDSRDTADTAAGSTVISLCGLATCDSPSYSGTRACSCDGY